MEITTYKGHSIRLARPSGGKAGKGCNKTSTVQVFKVGGNAILKAFRFDVDDVDSRKKAAQKARAFVDGLSSEPQVGMDQIKLIAEQVRAVTKYTIYDRVAIILWDAGIRCGTRVGEESFVKALDRMEIDSVFSVNAATLLMRWERGNGPPKGIPRG